MNVHIKSNTNDVGERSTSVGRSLPTNEKHDDRAGSPKGEFQKISMTPVENSTLSLSQVKVCSCWRCLTTSSFRH